MKAWKSENQHRLESITTQQKGFLKSSQAYSRSVVGSEHDMDPPVGCLQCGWISIRAITCHDVPFEWKGHASVQRQSGSKRRPVVHAVIVDKKEMSIGEPYQFHGCIWVGKSGFDSLAPGAPSILRFECESHNHRRLVHSHPHDDKKPCNDRLREEPRPVEDCPTLNRPCWKPPMSGNPGPNAGTRRKCPLRFSRCHAPFHGRSGANILRFEAQ